MKFKASLLCRIRDGKRSSPGNTKWFIEPYVELKFECDISLIDKPFIVAATALGPCKPYKLIVDGNNDCFDLLDFKIGKDSQMVSTRPLPCTIFSPEMAKEMPIDSMNEGQLATLFITRIK